MTEPNDRRGMRAGTPLPSVVVSFLRQGKTAQVTLLIVGNFTPVPRYNCRVGAPRGGW
jgi:hypothetical protein